MIFRNIFRSIFRSIFRVTFEVSFEYLLSIFRNIFQSIFRVSFEYLSKYILSIFWVSFEVSFEYLSSIFRVSFEHLSSNFPSIFRVSFEYLSRIYRVSSMSSLASNVASFTEFYRVVPSCTEFYENCITAHHGLIKYRGNGRSGPQIGPSDVQWRNDLAPGHPADWPIADRRQFRSDQSRVLKDFLIPAPPSISNTTQNSLFTEFYRVLPSFT